jgi:hypothetical protein
MDSGVQPALERSGTLRALRRAPSTIPALGAVALFVVWATDQGGYPVTHWGPGGLVVLALLAIAVVFASPPAGVPRAVVVAIGALAAYTAFSYLSILWAQVPGEAWEGANRTLLYLLVFALFALWTQSGRTALLLLGAWVAAMSVLSVFVLLHADAASARELQSLFPGGRFDYPSGYPNANAAQWLMAFWPAVLLARTERFPSPLRGALAGGAVLLGATALLSQSRGSLYATPVMIVIVLALLPGRWRTLAILLPVSAGLAAAAPALLHAGDDLRAGAVQASAVHGAVTASLVAAVAVALAVTLGAEGLSRIRPAPAAAERITSFGRIAGAATVLVLVAGALAAAGNPVARAEHAWNSFKGGYSSGSPSASRLVSGLGSNRYDIYRVAIDEFAAHPLGGIGADNFQQQYLLHGRSQETPHYPHSIELRTVSEGGVIGALLALIGLAAALLAGARAVRSPDPLARSVAAAALAGFAYWVVHGSFDWFWEFAGLGAPAFALLGLACALAPLRDGAERTARAPRPGLRAAAWATVSVTAVLAAASLALPWLSAAEVQSAAKVWTRSPPAAYSRLEDAASLDPLSDQPYLVAGSIALRVGDLARGRHYFTLALSRSSGDAYATLELGAIASASGQPDLARRWLERAVRLSPRDPVAGQALAVVVSGRRINVAALNREILAEGEQIA